MICQNGIVTVVINVGRLHLHPNTLIKMISKFEDKIAKIIQSKSNSGLYIPKLGPWPRSNKPEMYHCLGNPWVVSLAGYL